jgi:hypothetical protein
MNLTIPLELTQQNIRSLSYQVLVDMDQDNIFEVDITSDVALIDYIQSEIELKNKGTILGKPSSNEASITLLNTNGKFSPNNPNNIESLYPGTFRINTKIQILAGFIDQNQVMYKRNLFTGVIVSFKDRYELDGAKINLKLRDYAKYAQYKKNPNHNYNNGKYYEATLFDVSISDAVDYLIDYVYGESFPREIYTIEEKLPCIEFPLNQSVWSTIQKLSEACEAKAFFEAGVFKFYSAMSRDYNPQESSCYTFTASNIKNFTEDIDEENILNKIKITTNAKTFQPRQIIVGTPTTNIITGVDDYTNTDGKNALGADNKTITLKSQIEDLSWINTIYMPLVDTQTYSDLVQIMPTPTTEAIKTMNEQSIVKVFDKKTGQQLTIFDIVPGNSINPAQIILLNEINPTDYSLQITYQYYTDRIVAGKYKWYEFELDKISRNIEMPIVQAYDVLGSLVSYSYNSPTAIICLSDFQVLDGNKKLKFKLSNNMINPQVNNDIVRITKLEIYGNPLECISPATFEAVDGTTIDDFERTYEINNDYILNPEWGKQIADYYLYKYSSNVSFLELNTPGIPQIDLLDRVTITEIKSGINFDFIVNGIKHTIKEDGWKTSLSLESLVPPWVYDPDRVKYYYYKLGQNYLSLHTFAPPPVPLQYYVYQNMRQIEHVWKVSNDVSSVEIRKLNPDTLDWDFGQVITTNATGNKFIDTNVVSGVSTYGIKSMNRNGLLSTDMKIASVTVDYIPASNLIVAFDEFELLDGIVDEHAYISNNKIILEVSESWNDTTDELWNETTNELWDTPVYPEGIYQTLIKNLGKVLLCDVNIYDIRLTNGHDLYWRYSQDDPTCESSQWQLFVPGKYTLQYHQWRLHIKSPGEYVECTAFKGGIDVPDIIIKFPNSKMPVVRIVDAEQGVRVDYGTTFIQLPNIVGSVTNNIGYIVPEKHESYAIIRATKDGSSFITGDLDLQITGY